MRMTPARLLMLVVLVGVCIAGFLTQVGTRFTLYRSPFTAALPWGAAGPPLTERVVVCLVDGLRLDTSRTLEPVNALRERGADWELTVPEPTLSIPLSHVIATGAPQTTIGLLHNRAPIGPGFYRTFGTIYTAAREAGLRTGNVVTWKPGYPLAEFLDASHTLPGAPGAADDDALVPRVLDVLAQPDAPHLLWVHFDIVDRAGHVSGAASPAYRDAAQRTGDRIGAIAAAMDLSRETQIVTADHGHLDAGGHGGPEPETATVPCVLAGAGVTAGAVGHGAQVDLASTIAWLLGTPVPTHAEGWPLISALDVDAEFRARRSRDTLVQVLAAYAFRLEQVGVHDLKLDAPMPEGLRPDLVDELLERGEWDGAYALAANLATELRVRWSGWRAKLAQEWLRPRLYASTGLGLLAFVVSVVLRRRAAAAGAPPAKTPPLWLLAGVGVTVAVPILLYTGAGYGYSLSWVWWGGRGAFALRRMAEGAAGLVAGYATARLLARSVAGSLRPGTIVAGIAGSVAGVAVGGIAIYVVGVGVDPSPWQVTFTPLAILTVSSLHMLGVAALALPCAIAVAARAADRDQPPAQG